MSAVLTNFDIEQAIKKRRLSLPYQNQSDQIMGDILYAGAAPTAAAPKKTYKRRYKRRYGARKYKRRSYQYGRYARELRDFYAPRGSEQSINAFGADRYSANEAQLKLRRATRFYGKGGYWDFLKPVGKWAARGVGALAGGGLGFEAGGLTGAVEGAQAGYDRGAAFSKWAGWGAYNPAAGFGDGHSGGDVATNSLMQMTGGGPSQQISVNSDSVEGDVIISYTEFVQNVTVSSLAAGSSPFTVQSFPLNPGFSTTFPWLSQLANNFTLYEMNGLIFQYKPTSGDYGSTNSNALGKVIMCTNYDPDAPAFFGAQQMENYDYAVACKPSNGMYHAVETHPKQRVTNQMYVRAGSTTKDLTLCDLGLFQVATEGIYTGAAGTYVIGELWVTYSVKLSRKNLNDASLGISIPVDYFTQRSLVNSAPGGTMVSQLSRIGCVISSQTSTRIRVTFPTSISSGFYSINCWGCDATGTPFASSQNFTSVGAVSNCGLRSINSGAQAVQRAPNISTLSVANNVINYFILVTINAPGTLQAYVELNLSATLNASSQLALIVEQVPQALYAAAIL